MKNYRCFNIVAIVVILFSGGLVFAACPSADLTGDCFVGLEDFAVMAGQWLTTDPCVLGEMVYIPDKEDHPMVQASWYGSVAYCNWRSSEGGYEACYNLSTWDCDFTKKGKALLEKSRSIGRMLGKSSVVFYFERG